MPSLAGAITCLGLLGVPTNAPVFNSEYQASPRPYTVTFTGLSVGALPKARAVDFSGKTEETTAQLAVSDTASFSATEEPFDRNEIATGDTARLAANDTSQLFNRIDASDAATLSAGETISLIQSGVTLKPVSDTASLSATEAATLGVTIDVSDTASLTATDEATVDVSAETLSVSDTANLSADDVALLEIFAGIVEKVGSDSALLTVTDHAIVREVRRIRKIKFEVLMPRMTFEVL